MSAYRLRTVIMCVVLLLCLGISFAQNLISSHYVDDVLYQAHVKSLDEFIQRLNGKEINPLIIENDSAKVRATRYTLFDEDLLNAVDRTDSVPSVYEEFVCFLETDTTEVSVENSNNWIEARCRFTYNGSEKDLILRMQLEEDSLKCWRWTLFDIDGLNQSGLLDDEDILRISPVEHEINFIELESLFHYEYARMAGTRKSGTTIDRLSYFYGLIYSGVLKYDICQSVEFHCRQVPGYYFVVKELDRLESVNSGWLIISLIKTN